MTGVKNHMAHLSLKVLVLAALVLALFAASSRSEATPAPIFTGHLDWGVKESFRAYVVGPIAQGSITVTSPAAVNADGTFHFPAAATGTHDAATEDTFAFFNGSVRFLGHGGDLDMTISDVRVELDGDTGIIRMDVISRDLVSGEFESYPNVDFANLDLSAITPSVVGLTYKWTGIPAELSANGEPAFAGFYAAGEELDPASMTLVTGTDSDLDGVPNSTDNCSLWANPTQTLPAWALPSGDGDCDGFTVATETFLSTNPYAHCAATGGANNEPSPDAWPADFDDNQVATTLDLVVYVMALNKPSGHPDYVRRADLNGNGLINTLDLVIYVSALNKSCA